MDTLKSLSPLVTLKSRNINNCWFNCIKVTEKTNLLHKLLFQQLLLMSIKFIDFYNNRWRDHKVFWGLFNEITIIVSTSVV